MPIYCFRKIDADGQPSDEVMEKVLTISEAGKLLDKERKQGFVIVEGCKVNRDLASEHGGFVDTPGKWPQRSNALGVAPSQIKAAMKDADERGVPTRFANDGAAVFESREHRNRYMKAVGYRDNNAGYGDYAGQN